MPSPSLTCHIFDPFEDMDELEFDVFIVGAVHFEHLDHLQQEHGRNTTL
jgi:hypothetical protein